jgi:O-antigen/teichoic acid export membrane protein
LEFVAAVCGAGLNVLLNLLLVRTYGVLGAAWALIASEVFIWGLAYYFVRRTIAHVPFLGQVYRPLLGGVILASALYLLPLTSLWMAMCSAVLIYSMTFSIVQPSLLTDIRLAFVRNR